MGVGGEERFRVGGQVDKYEILGPLGRGGMATVYRALDISLNREVALKVLPGDVGESLLARFRTEIDLLSRLRHPNVVHVFETGTLGGRFYYAMRLYDGPDLDGLLAERAPRRPRLDVDEIHALALGLARALDHVHGASALHRDLKPANVMLGDGLHPVLMDFGLARPHDSKLTAENALAGTLLYMAPEQIAGGDLDARTDLYQLGLLLFEVVTGHLPFAEGERSGMAPIMARCEDEAPPLSLFVPETPPWLDSLVHGCLRRSPHERPASAALLVEALEARRPLPRPERRPLSETVHEGPSPASRALQRVAVPLPATVHGGPDDASVAHRPEAGGPFDGPPSGPNGPPPKRDALPDDALRGKRRGERVDQTPNGTRAGEGPCAPPRAEAGERDRAASPRPIRRILAIAGAFVATLVGSWVAWSFFSTQGLLLRGRNALRAGKAREAADLYRRALTAPWAADAAFLGALEAASQLDRPDEVLALLRTEAHRLRRLPRAAGLGIALCRRLREEERFEDLDRLSALLHELHPEHGEIAETRAALLHHRGEWEAALATLSAQVGDGTPSTRSAANRGCLLLLLGRHRQAVPVLDASLADGHDRSLVHLHKAAAAFVDEDRLAGEEELRRALIREDPPLPRRDFGAFLLGRDEFLLPMGARRARLPDDAMAAFWSTAGRIALDEGRPLAALPCLEEALRRKPDGEAAMRFMLRLHLEARDGRSALPLARRLLRLHPEDANLRAEIREALERIGRSDLIDALSR